MLVLSSLSSLWVRVRDFVAPHLATAARGNPRWIRILFLIFVYATVAAASFEGFYQKWGLRDGGQRYSFVEMIEGTAHRPFVNRQLLPKAANFVEHTLPVGAKEWIIEEANVRWWWEERNLLSRLRIDPVHDRQYLVRYLFVYFTSVAFLFAALFVMRKLCLEIGVGEVAATLAPALFALSLEYLLSMGGFFYDFPEVFFLATAFLLAYKGRWLALLPLSALATYNKESFVFFTPALLPLFLARYPWKRSVAIVGTVGLVAGLTHLLGRMPYLHNPGASAESWLRNSIRFYLNPKNLIAFEANYGIITPRAYSIFSFVLLGLLFLRGWRGLAKPLRQHGLLILAINFPLVLVFCGPGEMRNFSLCYMILLLVMAQNLSLWVNQAAASSTLPAEPALASSPEVRLSQTRQVGWATPGGATPRAESASSASEIASRTRGS